MHRVFHAGALSVSSASDAFADLRALLRSFELTEREGAGVYVYRLGARQVATMRGSMRSATLYLYPDALGCGPGGASSFYRRLDLAGLGMGSKAGPSIDVNLEDAPRLARLREGLSALFAPVRAQPDLTSRDRIGTVAPTTA